jgi:hypothetical protein
MSTCATITGSNGEKLAVVAGGYSTGMEVWNPIDGSVNILTPDFPLATGAGLPQMISIKNGKELIFYEAAEKPESERNGIWKYDVGTWHFVQHLDEDWRNEDCKERFCCFASRQYSLSLKRNLPKYSASRFM